MSFIRSHSVENEVRDFILSSNRKWYHSADKVYRFIVAVVLPCVLLAFGLIGNSVTMVVLSAMKQSTARILLIVLAAIDNSFLIVVVGGRLGQDLAAVEMMNVYDEPWQYYRIALYLTAPLVPAVQIMDVWTKIIIAVER